MSKLFTLVGRLWAWLFPSAAAKNAAALAPSPVERVLQHREHLFGSAVQLLDDEAAARQVVLEALAQAIRRAQALPSAAAAAPPQTEAPSGEPTDAPSLVRWLDRQVVSLAVARLQALSAAGVGRGLSHDGWPVVREPESALSGSELVGPGSPPGVAAAAGSPASASSSPAPASRTSAAGTGPAGEPAQLQRTAQVLAQLPTETRITLMLVAMQGRSITEVAELLGCREQTCRFWLSHGMKLMRRALQRDLVEDEFVSRESRLLLSPGALNDLRRSKKAAARA